MPVLHQEIEMKYDIDDSFEVPSLLSLGAAYVEGVAAVQSEPVTHSLEATYFDTADHRLAGAQLTLRRRTGGDDEGWHLKLPGAGGDRHEVRLPLGRSRVTVPVELRRMVRALTGDRPLVPVATLSTERTVRKLLDATGQVLVEVADDRVAAKRLAGASNGSPASSMAWRELEVELYGGGRELLRSMDEQLRQRGVQTADSKSKLARVLADGVLGAGDGAGVGQPAAAARDGVAPVSTAGEVVLRYVREQVRTIVSSDPSVRLDVPDSIHKMRVATRRLRSALQTFTPVLPTTVTRPLRVELTWLAGELGAARDAEVLRHRLVAAVAEQARGDDGGPLAHTVDVETSEAYRRAHESLLTVLDSDRYHQLVTSLDELATAPPMTRKASRPAQEVLPARAARAYAKLSDLVDAAHAAPAGDAQDHELHEARKAAKKARYAGEALKDVFGEPAARFAAAMEAVQEALGEHQDSVVMRERLRELAEQESSPAAAFGLGRLHALEERRGDQALETFDIAWKQARRKKLRRWLDEAA